MNEKRKSNREKLLALLSDGRTHHMRELHAEAGWRYGGRLKELRNAGHVIESIHIQGSEWEYRMIIEPKQGVLV